LGLYLTVLTTALSLILLFPPQAPAGQTGCLDCHKVHYAGRGGCPACHHGNDRTGRKRVAHDGLIPGRFAWFTIKGSQPVARGKRLLDLYACRRCHTAAGHGNRLAMNLDNLSQTRRPAEIALAIEKPAQCMPDFHLAESEIIDLVNAIQTGEKARAAKSMETPFVVHFADERKLNENIFEERCGGCHRMLSEKYGVLGRGETGPNLSGLLTSFYPETFREREKWSVEKLRKWLENPRAMRQHARMPPISIKSDEFGRLADILRATP
jgi:cytochrome c2